ncbi:2-oxoadipate dioxygenase/decarboxylase, chloroplastic/amyloplastic [Musa acuminata AAA Group]|uniref:2-oxoadipate dioxygenase/decarboxylase, chloroplastic/amyloplastic n=1 Tax=Musa acuminata AAA Group TaxID=214697 RepID=UPI0031E44152
MEAFAVRGVPTFLHSSSFLFRSPSSSSSSATRRSRVSFSSLPSLSRACLRRLHPFQQGTLPSRFISYGNRNLCMALQSDASSVVEAPLKGNELFLRTMISGMEKVYLSRNPTAKAILELVRKDDGEHICYDHFAFRTFGVDGHGIDSMAKIFLYFGYKPREELRFPAKKLRALWFAPPSTGYGENGTGIDGALPRIFISELLVDQLSYESQEVIRKYIKTSDSGYEHAALASTMGCLTWEKPLYSDYQLLSRESEYAAWTLVNGYALNHVTISTHRLKSHIRKIDSFNQFIHANGFKLNTEGGILKVSPDGLLLQSSTVADTTSFKFADGVTEYVACSYIEFAERLLLPEYKNIPDEEAQEFHRRDGFEVGNADKIFESTSRDQVTRKAA